MKTWCFTASRDGNKIDYCTTIRADLEPDFWTCYNLAESHGCTFWTVEPAETGPADPADDCTGCPDLERCRAGHWPSCQY